MSIDLTPTELLAYGVDVNQTDMNVGESFSTITRTYTLISKDPLVLYTFTYVDLPVTELYVKIKEEEIPTQGYMELQGYSFDIPAGATGNVSKHTIIIEQNVNVYCINIFGEPDNVNDTFSFFAGPTAPVGVLSQNLSIGDTEIHIASPVLSYYLPGFAVGTADGSLGRVKSVNVGAGKMTLRKPSTVTCSDGTYVYLWATRGSDLPMTNAIMELGNGKIGGSFAQEGLLVTFFYTNNTGIAKKLKLLVEDTY